MLALPLPHIFPSNEQASKHEPFAFAPDMSRPLLDPSTPSPSPVDANSRSAIMQPQAFLHQDQHQNQHQPQNHHDSLPDLPADKYHHPDQLVRRMSEPAALSPIYYASPESSSASSATMSNNPFAFSSVDPAESSSAAASRPLFAPSLHPRASTGSLRDTRLQHIAHQQQPTNNISHTRGQYRDTYTSYLDDEQSVSPTGTFAHNLPPPHPHAHAPPPSSSGSSAGGTMHYQQGLYPTQHGCSSTGAYVQQPYSPLSDMYGPSPPGTGTSTSSSLAGGPYGSLGSSGLSGSSLGPPLTPCSPGRSISSQLRRSLTDGAVGRSFEESSGHHDADDSAGHDSPSDADRKTYAFVALPGNAVKKRPRRRYDEIERMYMCNFQDCGKAYGTLNHLNAHVSMQRHGKKRTPAEFKELRKQWRKAKKEQQEAAALAQLALGPHGMHQGHHNHTLARRDSFPGAFGTQHGGYLDEEDYRRPSHSSHGFGGHSSHQQLNNFELDLEYDYNNNFSLQQQQQQVFAQNANPSSFSSSRMFHQQQQQRLQQQRLHQQQSHLPPSMLGAWTQTQQQQQQLQHHSQLPHLEIPPHQHHQTQYQQSTPLDISITDVDANTYRPHSQHSVGGFNDGNGSANSESHLFQHHDGVNASPFGFNAGAGGITVPAPNYHSQSQSPAGSRPGTGAGHVHGNGYNGMHLAVEGAGSMPHGLRRSLSASLEAEELQLQHSQEAFVAQS